MPITSFSFDAIFSNGDAEHDLGSASNRLNNVHAVNFRGTFIGDGQFLTGLPPATVDESADYNWTGAHDFDQGISLSDGITLNGSSTYNVTHNNLIGLRFRVGLLNGYANSAFGIKTRSIASHTNPVFLPAGSDDQTTGIGGGNGYFSLIANGVERVLGNATGVSFFGPAVFDSGVTATSFTGDGSALTGLPAASVDESSDYNWSGSHTFTGNPIVVPASTSSFQTIAGGIYLDGTTSGANISSRSGKIVFRSSTTAEICELRPGVFSFPGSAYFQWAKDGNSGQSAGVRLKPLANGQGILEQTSDSANDYAQGYYAYGTQTNSSNYERFVIRTQDSDVTEIGQEQAGTGTAREVQAIGSWRFMDMLTVGTNASETQITMFSADGTEYILTVSNSGDPVFTAA